jgi:transaldolase
VDALLKKNGTPEATALLGKAAIANAHLAYQLFEEKFASSKWGELAAKGANKQRPLWASTGVKDPAYPDTQYVVELIAPDTVNTMPQSTLDALIDHGDVRGNTISGKYPEAVEVLQGLSALGISLDQITTDLEIDGVKKFAQAWDELLENVKAAQQS